MIVVENCFKPLLSLMVGDSVLSFQSRFGKSLVSPAQKTGVFRGLLLVAPGPKSQGGQQWKNSLFCGSDTLPSSQRGERIYKG